MTDIQQFYTQTFNTYKDTKQEALRETLRAIQYGVSAQFMVCLNNNIKNIEWMAGNKAEYILCF